VEQARACRASSYAPSSYAPPSNRTGIAIEKSWSRAADGRPRPPPGPPLVAGRRPPLRAAARAVTRAARLTPRRRGAARRGAARRCGAGRAPRVQPRREDRCVHAGKRVSACGQLRPKLHLKLQRCVARRARARPRSARRAGRAAHPRGGRAAGRFTRPAHRRRAR
jgi:hypothetical protein